MAAAAAPFPTLYSFRRCPYAMRARLALSKSGQTCLLREIVLRDKPQSMLDVSAKGTVPVLVMADGTVLDESLDIMLWALGIHDPDEWLTPNGATRQDMLDLIADMDGPFKTHLDRYKYGTRYPGEDSTDHRQAGLSILEGVNERLADAPFLFGVAPCLADIAIFPFVRQFANTDRGWFDALPLPHLQHWLAGWLDSGLFKGVMQKWPVWQAGDDEPLFPEKVA